MKTIIVNDDFSNLEEFENAMSEELKILWKQFQEEGYNGLDYPDLKKWQNIFEPFKLTFDYGLDAEPYDFKIKV